MEKQIYALTLDGVILYVGQTNGTIKARLLKHRSNARTGGNQNPKLYSHMRSNGPDRYEAIHLETVDYFAADARERFWIEKYDTKNNGLNITKGGISPGGDEHYLYGKRPADHIIAASVAARLGKPLSAEHRAKIAAGNRGKKNFTIMKKVICLETGKIFDSVTDAAASCGGAKTNISLICRNNKGRVKGLTFRFYEEGKDANRRKLE